MLIKIYFFLALFGLFACQPDALVEFKKNPTDAYSDIRYGKIELPNGKKLAVKLAITGEEQNRGLSGVKADQFKNSQALLFFYSKKSAKRFWMPDTYFNLDIIFLDKHLKILAIEKNVPAHPGNSGVPKIAMTGTYFAQHVLEIKSSGGYGKGLKKGSILKWTSSPSLSEIESKIHLKQ
ncbi:MAG: DUF192 domain-containing protein [Halobacteriovoraceae bacterium]|jgi:uncharacterized protein|nr:DUF192 domain-containing protein [Halobacteriovoraceae bacterium]MBT5093944.1 DUF192 domain-containing protein [Halobacteriovoraceae bacterium]